MHTFRQTTSGRYEVGHTMIHDEWQVLFRVDKIEHAMRAVRYLNGGETNAFAIYVDGGREGVVISDR